MSQWSLKGTPLKHNAILKYFIIVEFLSTIAGTGLMGEINKKSGDKIKTCQMVCLCS